MTYYLNTLTGKLMDALAGNDLGPLTFVLKDIIEFDLVFTDGAGTNITATLLQGNQVLNLALKAKPGLGSVMALGSIYDLQAGVAKMLFNLNTVPLTNYFSTNVPSTTDGVRMHLEIQVVSPDNASRVTYFQGGCLVKAVGSYTTDEAPINVPMTPMPMWFFARADITRRTGGTAIDLDSLVTVNLPLPELVLIRFGGVTGEIWCLDTWDGVTAPDGVYVVNPVDYNVVTNRRQWKRII